MQKQMESTYRRGKRKREEEKEISQQTNDALKAESSERKRRKQETKRRHGKLRCRRRRRPRQQETSKPETFESLYTVGEKLGEGGFGSVFAGTRVSDGLQVAIKFVPKQEGDRYIPSPLDSRPIPLEVVLMQKMSEPPVVDNVIQLIQWFDEPKRYILVLERPHPCKDLSTLIQSHGGSFYEQMARYLMLQVVQAVIECHKRGVFHRDIKVENILINTETAELKLIDFGCGDLIRRFGYNYFEGTSEYCPPEYLLTGRYCATPATVWSLGVMLFGIVSGSLPFKNDEEIIGGCLLFKDGLSDELCDLVRWCLQPQPSSRPNFQQILEHKWFRSSFPDQEEVSQVTKNHWTPRTSAQRA